ncbi:hypothetical protein MHY85_18640, partial [Cellulomonas sp. ACRRI]|nr:hypothetical protein [Cellulomonas sp. ACRRI]
MARAQTRARRRPDRFALDPTRWVSAVVVAALAATLALAGPAPAWAGPAEPEDGTAPAAADATDEPGPDAADDDPDLPELAPVPQSAAEAPVHLGTGTVQLTSSATVLEIGQSFRLTARVDEPLELTGSELEIVDSTADDAVVQTCTSGTSCTVDVTGFLAGGPRVYMARVGELASGEVTVERRPWTVSLSGPTEFSAGSDITFNVDTNQLTGQTDGNYTVHVQDLTTGTVAGTCDTTGGVRLCHVKTRYYTGGPRDYRAVIAAPNGPDIDVQAISNTITVQRTPWTVALSGPTQFSAGSDIT